MAADTETTTAEDTKAADTDAGEQEDVKPSPFAEFIEHDGDTTRITFRETVFSFPRHRSDWPTRAMQVFQRGEMSTFPDGVELMLGDEQWERFNEIAPRLRDFWEFFPIFAEAVGFVLAPVKG